MRCNCSTSRRPPLARMYGVHTAWAGGSIGARMGTRNDIVAPDITDFILIAHCEDGLGFFGKVSSLRWTQNTSKARSPSRSSGLNSGAPMVGR